MYVLVYFDLKSNNILRIGHIIFPFCVSQHHATNESSEIVNYGRQNCKYHTKAIYKKSVYIIGSKPYKKTV
jgi:hypothetical protein